MSSLRFGDFVLEARLQRLLRDGEVIPLKPKAFDLLGRLLAEPDRVLTKNELLDYLWPRQEVTEANLTQTIYELRQALGDSARSKRWIETVPRRGYRFNGTVSAIADQSAPFPLTSIAVLPFRAVTSQSGIQELGLGIADAIIVSLGADSRLVTRSLSAVLPYVDSKEDSLTIARSLEVDAVLEGTVQQFGERIRVNTRLRSTEARADLWTEKMEYGASDPFAIQDSVAESSAMGIIAAMGRQTVNRQSAQGGATPAHSAYLKARYCWQRWTPDTVRQALSYLDDAISLDPRHAPSHAWRSAAWSVLGILGEAQPSEVAREARQAAQRAIRVDENCADGHEMLGAVQLFFDWDLSAAARSFDRAIELNPESSNARHLRAIALAVGGHDQAACAEINRALRTDPTSAIANADMGMIHYWGRRFPQAKQWFEATLEQDPAFSHARSGLAFTLVELGDEEAALREIREAAKTRGNNGPGELAYILGRTGHTGEARRVVAAFEKQPNPHFDPYQHVLASLGASNPDRTFEALELALEYRSRDLLLLGVNPIADPIRGDQRFETFMRRAQLPMVD